MMNCINQGKNYVEVTNFALIVMRFSIICGREIQTTDNMLIGAVRRLYFPEGVDEVTILMEEIYPPTWAQMFKGDYRTNQNYCFAVYGTFLLPIIKPRPCTNSSSICGANELQLQSQEIINSMYQSYLSSITQCKL